MGYQIGNVRGQSLLKSRWILTAAIISNLALLGYFKYTNFFIDTINQLSESGWSITEIILPLGISFFTFTQISFLVDVYKGIAKEYDFVHYLLFVTYFPHLIAGPVLHHKQMMPQFEESKTYRLNIHNINIGLTIFSIGLFKKVVLADQFAQYADPVFNMVATGEEPQLIEAWIGALAYTLQLYFDFSAYSDMAVGLSKIFNVNLPINFYSPYKSTNIIEFWRRWHMTLSAFLKDYVYIPLGGNRYGISRRYMNLLATMLVGGLWHGANWTFVFWGGLHGVYLVINHGWQALCKRVSIPASWYLTAVSVAITFAAVVFAWVFFRAESFDTALRMVNGMLGINGLSLPMAPSDAISWLASYGVVFNGHAPITQLPLKGILIWIPLGLMVVWFMPNCVQIAKYVEERVKSSFCVGFFVGSVFLLTLMSFKKASPFIYFQF